MPLPARFIGADETQLIHTRTHWKVLFAPVLWFILFAALLGAGLALIPRWFPQSAAGWISLVWVALMVIAMLWLVLIPFLNWYFATYTITDHRLISRRGLIHKTGHDLPLRRINDVSYERHIVDRILGCGTLVLTTAAERPVILDDVPHVERVHLLLNELLFDEENDDDRAGE